MVLLSGEAGIGKSRLTAALMERLEGEPHTRLRYFCSPQHTDSALYPVIGQMERAAGLAYGDTAQSKLDKLDALLAQTSTSAQDVSLFADMVAADRRALSGARPGPTTAQAENARGAHHSGGGIVAAKPLLMIFEDAPTDPGLETFGRVVGRVAPFPLLIVTFRPEFEPPGSDSPCDSSPSIGWRSAASRP